MEMVQKEYKCKNCGNLTGHNKESNLKFPIIIPDHIAPIEAIEKLYAGYYKYGHHNFCDKKCFNLKLIDDMINHLSLSLMMPEEHFLPKDRESNIVKARETLNKLNEFKSILEVKE
ncbi:hypothetical protein QUF79_14560 [Fictibacillus enclensis]|uniref:hypothetical protein n=1 Tax=Fictibacillus enclensis TaxID=1017270 RepID=UPI0025A1DA8E|nr:hypothetical protein [Fictibacillus enclensis]MDM5199240.1 hypothetical protein [Fictibacillus enclensis]